MISKPTVLILGAGASMPFGFPSGEGLVSCILNELEEEELAGTPLGRIRQAMQEEERVRHVLAQATQSPEPESLIDRFHKALLRSGRRSIDNR